MKNQYESGIKCSHPENPNQDHCPLLDHKLGECLGCTYNTLVDKKMAKVVKGATKLLRDSIIREQGNGKETKRTN